jgi:hypothetical protein
MKGRIEPAPCSADRDAMVAYQSLLFASIDDLLPALIAADSLS